MIIHNSEIARIFNRLADLLEISNENPYRIRAYRNAAMTVSSLSGNIEEMVRNHNNLTELTGIGKDLAEKIVTIINTGELPLLKEIEKTTPSILCELPLRYTI